MRRATAVLALAAVALVAGCGSDGGSGPAGARSEDLDVVGGVVDLPAVCLEQYVGLMSEPDLDRVSLPESWPEPPVAATLCKTEHGSTADEVGYATDASPDQVLAAYADALAAHAPERTQDDGYGAGTVAGVLDGVHFVVQPRTGSFEIVLIQEAS